MHDPWPQRDVSFSAVKDIQRNDCFAFLMNTSSPGLLKAVLLVCIGALTGGCGYVGPAEKGAFPEACSIPDAEMALLDAGPFQQLERAGRTLVYLSKEDRYAMLELGCRLTRFADVPNRTGLASPMQVNAAGARFFSTYAQGGQAHRHWYSPGPSAAPWEVPLDPALTKNANPVLSDDGMWVALLHVTRTREESRNEIILFAPNGEPGRTFWPAGVDWSWYELVAIDVAQEQVVLSRGLREYLWARFDGSVIRGPINTGSVQAQPQTFRWTADGWFAWDAYRDRGDYRWALSKSGQITEYAAENLRQISHGAIAPGERYAAVSLETKHGRILSLRDAVVIYDTSTGEEVFRKYLPRFTRTQVAFLTDEYFAYGEPGRIRVLRLSSGAR